MEEVRFQNSTRTNDTGPKQHKTQKTQHRKKKSILEGFQFTTSVVVLSTDCIGSWDVSPYSIGTSGTKI
jgi:hypothetical protein